MQKRKLKRQLINLAIITAIVGYMMCMPSTATVYKSETVQEEVATTTPEVVPVIVPVEKPVPKIGRKLTPAELEKWKIEREATLKVELSKYFDEATGRVALAVIKQESSMSNEAIAYNCYYTKLDKNGKTVKYSTFCKKGDEGKAWSVDCGIAQINLVGKKSCPDYTKDLTWSIDKMVEMHKVRGFNPWVAYTSGAYKKCLE